MSYYNYAKGRKKLIIPPFFEPAPREKSTFTDRNHVSSIPLVMKPVVTESADDENNK